MRWHPAHLVTRLALDESGRRAVVAQLRDSLEDDGRIVRTRAMQALAELAAGDAALRAEIVPLREACGRTGSPAMRGRGCRPLAWLADDTHHR